ncbi:MAG TPA: hypothetical protein VE844_03450 [Gammaproteobacteria bacterium]|nr:hypothetical protein [Gammaproteobacteria bacterium]
MVSKNTRRAIPLVSATLTIVGSVIVSITTIATNTDSLLRIAPSFAPVG